MCKKYKGDWTKVDEEYQNNNPSIPVSSGFMSLSEFLRQRRTSLLFPSPSTTTGAPAPPAATDKHPPYVQPTYLPPQLKKGAYLANDAIASNYIRMLTKCRKCGYYSYTSSELRDDPERLYKVEGTAQEWCQACGRVAPLSFKVQKNQCHLYTPKSTDVLLGTKTIPFTIRSHDPRKMEAFKSYWAKYKTSKSPNWKFSAAEMEKDMFDHRIGALPTLEMVLKSIPVLSSDKIPVDGDRTQDPQKTTASMDDTDAILMDREGRVLFQTLFPFRFIGYPKHRQNSNNTVVGDIRAQWNATERRGVSIIDVVTVMLPTHPTPFLIPFV
jgi:ribosomal protein L37E